MPSATSWTPSSGIGMSIVNVLEGPGGGGGLGEFSLLELVRDGLHHDLYICFLLRVFGVAWRYSVSECALSLRFYERGKGGMIPKVMEFYSDSGLFDLNVDLQFRMSRSPGTWAGLEDALSFGIKTSDSERKREIEAYGQYTSFLCCSNFVRKVNGVNVAHVQARKY